MVACADGSDKNYNAKLGLSPVLTTGPLRYVVKTAVHTWSVAHEHNLKVREASGIGVRICFAVHNASPTAVDVT